MRPEAPISSVTVSTYRVPTDAPEADGTFEWDSTTMVVAKVTAGDRTGLGYTYAAAATAALIKEMLAPSLPGADAFATERLWQAMVGKVRNAGWRGIAATAISALDVALWDLKARLLEGPPGAAVGRRTERGSRLR
jgi:L-alanine-DL-glutamate epimerase-like enolase superfamily enzyme